MHGKWRRVNCYAGLRRVGLRATLTLVGSELLAIKPPGFSLVGLTPRWKQLSSRSSRSKSQLRDLSARAVSQRNIDRFPTCNAVISDFLSPVVSLFRDFQAFARNEETWEMYTIFAWHCLTTVASL